MNAKQARTAVVTGAGSGIGRAVRHMAELPPAANVQFATVLATTMPYIGRG